jgi:hypothetical protein
LLRIFFALKPPDLNAHHQKHQGEAEHDFQKRKR